MDLRDATLMLATQSGDPLVAGIARPAYDDLCCGRDVPHTAPTVLLGHRRAPIGSSRYPVREP
jgi:hypothetical protein